MKTNKSQPAASQLVRIRPRPVRAAEEALQPRRLHCRKYDACLNIAAEKDWPGFSCRMCQAFESVDFAEIADRDHGGLLMLAGLIGLGEEDVANTGHAEMAAA